MYFFQNTWGQQTFECVIFGICLQIQQTDICLIAMSSSVATVLNGTQGKDRTRVYITDEQKSKVMPMRVQLFLSMAFDPKSKIKVESDYLALVSSLHYCFTGLSPTSLLVWIVPYLTLSEMFTFSHIIKCYARS